ncbi:MAG: hypothetical protein M3417_06790 [Actinomycetota bacterium]|nr:hypothetical protein [Actinomycetota bacterium]
MPALKHLDLVVLALALPVFLAAGFPLAGYATGAVAWIVQKVIKEVTERRALEIGRRSAGRPGRDESAAIADMRKVAGLTAGSMIGRGWLSALTIFAGYFLAGQDDRVGLAAAVLVIVCFTASFVTLLVLRPFETPNELPS